ncbi:MAG: epoxyqueuosine reductase [Syntrophobacterales bacterium]|nr:epoxyqueuosine reductase [Syntrophobacterales bacterium]
MELSTLARIVIDTLITTETFPYMWRDPLMACARADDPLFLRLKEVVTPDHLMPDDLLKGAKSVIVYFIPFRREIGIDNSSNYPFASELWARAYIETNTLISTINERLSGFLSLHGYRSAITPPTHNFDPELLVSRWSHKHIGFIAGLGTFGLHRLLITPLGCCGRLGSIVTDAYIEPSKYQKEEICLERRGTKCSKCASRCPVQAIGSNGEFNRKECYRMLLENDRRYGHLPLTDVCGHCSCEVPCSYGVPTYQASQELP